MSQRRVISAGSLRIETESFGEAHDPHVLLISGAGAPAEFWPEEFCRQLAMNSVFVIRYCHRDTGLSSHFDQPYEIDALLQDLMAVVDFHESPQVHMIGHSMGGYLAQMALCRYPARVASVTSISAGSTVDQQAMARLGMSQPTDDTWRLLMRNKPTGDLERDLPGWLEVWRFLNGDRLFDEDLATRYTRALYVGDDRNWQVAANHVHAMKTVPESLAHDLGRAHGPLLVIHGTEDPLVPLDNGEATAKLAPSCSLHRLQGAGHMFFHADIWQEISAILEKHLLG